MNSLDIKYKVGDNGKISAETQRLYDQYHLQRAGKWVQSKVSGTRKVSHPQYGYLYGVLYTISAYLYTGNYGLPFDEVDMDEHYKMAFWSEVVYNPVTKELTRQIKSKTEMEGKDMTDYIEAVRKDIEEKFDFIIPETDDEELSLLIKNIKGL